MSVYRCEVPGCGKPIKLDTEPWSTRRIPATNRKGICCEPCTEAIDAVDRAGVVDPADEALERDVHAAAVVDLAVRARERAAQRPPEGNSWDCFRDGGDAA